MDIYPNNAYQKTYGITDNFWNLEMLLYELAHYILRKTARDT